MTLIIRQYLFFSSFLVFFRIHTDTERVIGMRCASDTANAACITGKPDMHDYRLRSIYDQIQI